MSWDLGGDNLSDEFGVSREDVPFPPPRFLLSPTYFVGRKVLLPPLSLEVTVFWIFLPPPHERGDCREK